MILTFDINKLNRVQVRARLSNKMVDTSCVNAVNLTHALATVFDSNLMESSILETIKVEKIGEIKDNEIDPF